MPEAQGVDSPQARFAKAWILLGQKLLDCGSALEKARAPKADPEVISCPKCSQKMRVPDGSAGKQVKCPTCKTVFVVGAAAAADPALILGHYRKAAACFLKAIKYDQQGAVRSLKATQDTRAARKLALHCPTAEESVALLGAAVQAYPSDADSLVTLGNYQEVLGRHAEAEASYRRALDKAKDEITAHVSLASALKKLGRAPDEYREHLQEARRLLSNSQGSNYNRACLEAVAGNLDEAFRHLESALQKDFAEPVELSLTWPRQDPDLHWLRADPRFERLLTRRLWAGAGRYDVFFSYSAKSKVVVGPAVKELMARGLRVWLDRHKAYESAIDAINGAMANSRDWVLWLSKDSLQSGYSKLEAEDCLRLFANQKPEDDRRLLFVLLDDEAQGQMSPLFAGCQKNRDLIGVDLSNPPREKVVQVADWIERRLRRDGGAAT